MKLKTMSRKLTCMFFAIVLAMFSVPAAAFAEGDASDGKPMEMVTIAPQSEGLTVAADKWAVTATANKNTTTAALKVDPSLISTKAFDTVKFTAKMSYKNIVTREKTKTVKASEFNGSGQVNMDFGDYGKFSLTAEFQKNGATVHTTTLPKVGIIADTYNISPVSASLPVTFFSLNLWGSNNIRQSGPVILLMERPAAYDWSALPKGVYGLPFMSIEDLSYQPGDFGAASDYFRANEQIMADYVKDLMEISPNSKFNLYCVDFYLDLVQRVIYANKIPQGNYFVYLLSDGSYTAATIGRVYTGSNPASIHSGLVSKWNTMKSHAYANGKVDSNVTPGSCGDYLWAFVDSEPNSQLWVARKDVMKTNGDGNVFGKSIQDNGKVIQVSIGNLLKNNIQSSAQNTKEFKALYNFNDGFFSEAEDQGKDAMVFLGSRVTAEEAFTDYARFVMTYYGDKYVYYYKGHPGTPTDLYPEKVSQLSDLGITDVDSSIAAELILFFNPEIYLSGYASSTYDSVPVGMGKGMFKMTRAEGLANPQYKNMEFWMSKVADGTDSRVKALCTSGATNYLVEFSDTAAKAAGYGTPGKTATRYIAIWDATNKKISYYRLNDAETAYTLVGTQTGTTESRAVPEGTYVIQSELANGMVLDVSGGARHSGANVQLYGFNDTNAQKWKIAYDGNNLATITNIGSGLALDVSGANTSNGTNVQQWTPNGTLAQKWRITRDSNGQIRIVSALKSTVTLDISGAGTYNGTNVQIFTNNDTNAQKFSLLPLNPTIKKDKQASVADGYYTIAPAANRNLNLALADYPGADGTNLQVSYASESASQVFRITKLSNGYYRITSMPSGRAVDLDKGSIIPGTNVHVWNGGNDNVNEQWAIFKHTGGSYTFQNVKSGQMLDLAWGQTSSGANVHGYTANGSQAQRWLLSKTSAPAGNLDALASKYESTIADGTYEIQSALGHNLVMDVSGGSKVNGANVQSWTSNSTGAQKWQITHDDKGYLTIKNVQSGLVLDVSGAGSALGTNVWQYRSNGTNAQKWVAVPSANGGYEILSAVSPYLSLDISGASTRQGANMQVWNGNGTAAQRFTFKKL